MLLVQSGFPEKGERGDQGQQGFRGLEGPPGPVGPPDPEVAKRVESLGLELNQVSAQIVSIGNEIAKAKGADKIPTDVYERLAELEARMAEIEKKSVRAFETLSIRPGGGFPFAKPGLNKIAVGGSEGLWELRDVATIGGGGGGGVPTSRVLTAGDGLSGGGDLSADRTFTVNVDGSTIETAADTLRVKDGGITIAKLSFDPATQAELDAHLTDASDAHDASAISSVPAGGLAATDVQAALNELDTEKVPIVRTITAGDGLSGGGDLSADRSFAVNVDDASIEINSDTLRVKATGVGSAHLSSEIITTINDHSWRHERLGPDEILLDNLGTPEDNTDLNATTGRHGLLPKLSGSSAQYLDGTGAFTVPPGTGDGGGGSIRLQATVVPLAQMVTVGDDKNRFFVSDDFGGMNLIDADASKLISGGGGTLTLQIRNVTAGDVNMLSTPITIDPNEFNSYGASVAPVIDLANDGVVTGDLIAFDVDDSGIGGSAIGPFGLNVTLAFKVP